MVIAVSPTGNTVVAEAAARAGRPFAPAWTASDAPLTWAFALLVAGCAEYLKVLPSA